MPAFQTTAELHIVAGSKAIDREAVLEPNGETIRFGMHGGVSEHYKYQPDEEYPSTLDYLAASIGGCLIGTFAGSLRRARIPVNPGEALTGVVHGHVVPDDDGVLRLRKISLDYTLALEPEHRDAATEVLDAHAARCPNARSVADAIEIETSVTFTDPTG